mmetsp:Transcript_12400/g.25735  ORF Transcript_12400/g.25735 Transcript_12400/m.25735 type:complete len:83 (+) Transcript_12400:127-375(+)
MCLLGKLCQCRFPPSGNWREDSQNQVYSCVSVNGKYRTGSHVAMSFGVLCHGIIRLAFFSFHNPVFLVLPQAALAVFRATRI